MSNLSRRHVVIHFPAFNANAVEEIFDGSGGAVKADKRHRDLLKKGMRTTKRVEVFTNNAWRALLSIS